MKRFVSRALFGLFFYQVPKDYLTTDLLIYQTLIVNLIREEFCHLTDIIKVHLFHNTTDMYTMKGKNNGPNIL